LSGLFDFFQSASNAVADNVAGPVDLINAGLGLFGLRSKEPVGGSEWMKRWGLKRDVEMSGARLAGETAGLLSPTLLAAKAPQIAKGLLQAQENAAIPRQFNPEMGAIVYHGSPHKFDKFDSSKIGTGEGAQAYGHGLYLADSPGVAESYQKALSKYGELHFPDGKTLSTEAMPAAQKIAAQQFLSIPETSAAKFSIHNLMMPKGVDRKDVFAAFDDLVKRGAKPSGNLYKVDLPDEAIAKMLDWDKPLSQQAPEVQKAVSSLPGMGYADSMKTQGHSLYGSLSDAARWADTDEPGIQKLLSKAEQQRLAAEKLRALGIPGIRYLDGGSRGAGTGTSNYVVFPGEEGLLSIVERNGQPLRGLMSPRTLDDLRATWGKSGVTMDVGSSRIQPDILNLSKIEVPKGSRGQGIGTAAMTDLVKFADESGKKVALSPSVDFGASSKGRLVGFYKRFGFVENKGKNKDFTISESMYRLPKK
jgi:predicted GNAT family acetyltransferase